MKHLLQNRSDTTHGKIAPNASLLRGSKPPARTRNLRFAASEFSFSRLDLASLLVIC